MRTPNVLTISSALPFIDTFVGAFLAGRVVPGFEPAGDPLRLADATIFVPTRRSRQALVESFVKHTGTPSTVLPRIVPLGAIEAIETPLMFREKELDLPGLPLKPVASSIWRRLQLTSLIQRWSDAVRGALCRIDETGKMVVDASEPFRVATSTVDAFALAGDLARLIDEMRIEGVEWRELDTLQMASFDDYWRITTAFLSIAIDEWPKILRDHGRDDPSARQIAVVQAQAAALAADGRAGPIVALGSTGTNKATADMLAAIARAPLGAVVLPGLDQTLDEAAWALVSGRIGEGQEPSFGHPQAALARLLPTLGIARADIRPLGTPTPAAETRARFVSEALRPADTTDLWRRYRREVPKGALNAALAGIRLVEAADEREEALCIAIAMREALETPGRTAALVTPDRELSRRVRGELLRWDLEVFDTGGEPLSARPLGVLARLVVDVAASEMGAREITALLGHPLACFGAPRERIARLATALEIGVLRVVPLKDKSADTIFAEARTAANEQYAHPAQKAIGARDWSAMADLWATLTAAMAPLGTLEQEQDLAAWVAAHRQVLAAIAGESDDDEADALDDLFVELAPGAGATVRFDAEGYAVFFGQLAGEVMLRNTRRPHPRLQIFGLLEARLMQADVMILGGLDEGIWPPQTTGDAFLNRPMRHELGLTPPERRIGQTAHDFAQAMGNPTIVLTHARKRNGSPCVPSRFLLRLEALGGRSWDACRARGLETLQLARRIVDPQKAAVPLGQPRPTPPVHLRPIRLSVTAIETLRRDPYSVYAQRILRLAPLPRIGAEIAPTDFGQAMHAALHHFVSDRPPSEIPAAQRERLRGLMRTAFDAALEDPSFEAFRWPSIMKAVDVFLEFDAKQVAKNIESVVETEGQIELILADQSKFTLSARADRIDFHADGSALLIDYKTGQPPGTNEVQVGFAPQLTLEAAILREGGFARGHMGEMAATYLKLGGRNGGEEKPLKIDDFAGVVDRHFAGVQQLLSSFRTVETSYPSRPFPKFAKDYGDYDHLARVREWALADDDEAIP